MPERAISTGRTGLQDTSWAEQRAYGVVVRLR